MLKIYTLPEKRRKELIAIAKRLPKNPRFNKHGKRYGISKPEWHKMIGYMGSREFKSQRKPKKTVVELKKLPYQDYLRTDHWKELRKKVKQRDVSCRICNSLKRLNVHHRCYESKGDAIKEINDLVLLCKDCHELFHKHKRI